MLRSMLWLGSWPDHDWQVWEYGVGHRQLHLRGIPVGDPGGPCVELLFKNVNRLATSTMIWSGLRIGLRRVTVGGAGVFFLVSNRSDGRHHGHGVVQAGALAVTEAGLDYGAPVLQSTEPLRWTSLWRGDR